MKQLLTRKMIVTILATLLGIGLSSVLSTSARPHAKPHPAVSAAWLPDASLAATLGPQVMVDGYKMHLPVGYAADLKNEQAKGSVKFRFFSLHRPDNVGPSMIIAAVSIPPKAAAADTPGTAKQLLDGDGYTHGQVGRIKTQPQTGRINGLQAARQYFRYAGTGGHEKHGFHYGVVDGTKRLLIVVVDDEPYSKTSLPLAEAAVLTLRK